MYKLKPAVKDYIWGGTNLLTYWNKQSTTEHIAECWELSMHPDGMSIVAEGPHAGKPLAEVFTPEDYGANCQRFEYFPLLVKLIDAKGNLSVQVHPNDEYALKNEHQYGKTEMWYILQAEEGASLFFGLNRDMTKQEFSSAVEDGSIVHCLNRVPVRAGQTYFIPSGTIHAIGAGITLIEIQQNSSLTYRLYDYGRVGADGKPRQLHIEKGADVAHLKKMSVPDPNRDELLAQCAYFTTCRYQGERVILKMDSFVTLTVIDGEIVANDMHLVKGDTIVASAGESLTICGKGTYIASWVD